MEIDPKIINNMENFIYEQIVLIMEEELEEAKVIGIYEKLKKMK